VNQPSIMEMYRRYQRNTGHWKIERQGSRGVAEAEFTGDTH